MSIFIARFEGPLWVRVIGERWLDKADISGLTQAISKDSEAATRVRAMALKE